MSHKVQIIENCQLFFSCDAFLSLTYHPPPPHLTCNFFLFSLSPISPRYVVTYRLVMQIFTMLNVLQCYGYAALAIFSDSNLNSEPSPSCL